MDLGPRLDHAPLTSGEIPCHPIDRIDREDRDVPLMVGMEVRSMTRTADLGEHADDDSEESRQLRHTISLGTGPGEVATPAS